MKYAVLGAFLFLVAGRAFADEPRIFVWPIHADDSYVGQTFIKATTPDNELNLESAYFGCATVGQNASLNEKTCVEAIVNMNLQLIPPFSDDVIFPTIAVGPKFLLQSRYPFTAQTKSGKTLSGFVNLECKPYEPKDKLGNKILKGTAATRCKTPWVPKTTTYDNMTVFDSDGKTKILNLGAYSLAN